jgi:hypothetical protein
VTWSDEAVNGQIEEHERQRCDPWHDTEPEDSCSCVPCERPSFDAPWIAHGPGCCSGSLIVEYDFQCPIPGHVQWAHRQFPGVVSDKEQQ